MPCSLEELRSKEVISAKTGCKLGNVSDIEIDTLTGKIISLIIFEKGHLFSSVPKEGDIKIKWEEIQVIGEDIILVCTQIDVKPKSRNSSIIGGLFR